MSSDARRTFWPLRPIASESWSSSTTAWMVLASGSLNTLRHPRRRERQPGEPLRIGRPRHDVDALAAQLVHDRLHARALEADARADRIDGVVARDHGDLGAAADFARDGADLDDLLLDLGHLELEQRLDEQRIAAATG